MRSSIKEKDLPLTVIEYSYNDIKKIDFKSEKDFISALETVLQNTTDTVIDWKKREAAIKRIGGIILGNFGKSDLFYKYYNQKIHINLSIQMADLRSSLMKEACRIVALSGKELESKRIENGVEKMLTQYVLYKLCGSANKVISDTCGNCIALLVKYVQSIKIIGRVCEQATSKGTAIKLRCAQALMIICYEYPEMLIIKAQQLIEDSLKVLMGDANGDVRATARKAYLIYKMNYEEQANMFFQGLERNIQKQINDDELKGVNINIKYEQQQSTSLNKTITDIYESQCIEQQPPVIQRKKSNEIRDQRKLNTQNNNSNPNLRSHNNQQPITNIPNISTNQKINKYSPSINNYNASNKDHNQTENNLLHNSKYIYQSAGIKPTILTKQNDNISKSTVLLSNNKNLNMNNNNNIDNSNNNNINAKKNILKNLNSRLEELSVITGGNETQDSISNNEDIESLINKHINIIENTDNLNERTMSFTFFYNNFTQIHTEINSISKTTMKNLVDTHIENLTESDRPLIIQIMKNLVKFFFYIGPVFTHFDINAIVKLLITHLSSKNPEIEKMCNQLLEIIRKKNRNDIIFKAIFELLQEGDCEEDIAYTALLPLVDKCIDLLNNKQYYSEIFPVICNGDSTNKPLIVFIDRMFRTKQDAFINAFTNETIENQKQLLMIAKTNNLFFYKNLKYIIDNQQQQQQQQSQKQIIEQNDEGYMNVNEMQDINEINEDMNGYYRVKKNANNIYIEPGSVLTHNNNNNSNNKSNRTNSNLGHTIPKEVSDAIFNQNINTFLKYLSNNRNYIPHFISLISVKALNPHLKTILAFVYSLITSPLYVNDLDKYVSIITDNLKIALVGNRDDQQMFDNLKELFFLLPLKLNAEKTLLCLSKFLTLTNDEVLIQIVLLSIKNFIINNKNKNLAMLLPTFIDGVFNMLNHKSSDIRKQAVYTSVEVYVVIGYKFEQYLQELPPNQQNLIRIFIKTRTAK